MNNETPIYTITTIRSAGFKTRCVGFFYDLDTAIKCVEENACDIYEDGYYLYCVIEERHEGIYDISTKEYWFMWENGKYAKIDKKPERFNSVINFSFG